MKEWHSEEKRNLKQTVQFRLRTKFVNYLFNKKYLKRKINQTRITIIVHTHGRIRDCLTRSKSKIIKSHTRDVILTAIFFSFCFSLFLLQIQQKCNRKKFQEYQERSLVNLTRKMHKTFSQVRTFKMVSKGHPRDVMLTATNSLCLSLYLVIIYFPNNHEMSNVQYIRCNIIRYYCNYYILIIQRFWATRRRVSDLCLRVQHT